VVTNTTTAFITAMTRITITNTTTVSERMGGFRDGGYEHTRVGWGVGGYQKIRGTKVDEPILAGIRN
jgi:hypothetical protein